MFSSQSIDDFDNIPGLDSASSVLQNAPFNEEIHFSVMFATLFAQSVESKLTVSQRCLLPTYFGRIGIHLETIRENKDFNLGTKLLYLERAVNETPKGFLESLEKLSVAPDQKTESTIALIRALKGINDLYHNKINHDNAGTKKVINSEISHLKARSKEDFSAQMRARTSDEWNIRGNGNLAIMLDLPLNQRAPSLSLFYNEVEWVQKCKDVRAWLLDLRKVGIIESIFTDSCHPILAHSMALLLRELAWSDIPFTRENVKKAFGVGTARLDPIAIVISNLSFYKLDNQANFNTITDYHICLFVPEIIDVMNALHWMGVSITQENFEKLIAHCENICGLKYICEKIQFIPGGINQGDFDALIQNAKYTDDIYKKLMQPSCKRKLINREGFAAIVESVRQEKAFPPGGPDLFDLSSSSSSKVAETVITVPEEKKKSDSVYSGPITHFKPIGPNSSDKESATCCLGRNKTKPRSCAVL